MAKNESEIDYENRFKVYDYMNSNVDMQRIATYITNNFPDIVSRDRAKTVAKELMDNGVTWQNVSEGKVDKEICGLIDDLKEIIQYMTNKFRINDAVALSVLKDLLKSFELSKEEIISGRVDDIINKNSPLLPIDIKANSVRKHNEENKKQPLKTMRKKASISAIMLIVNVIIVSTAVGYAKEERENAIEEKNNSNNLATIAGLDASEGTIVEQSKINVSGYVDGGAKVATYDYAKIATDIIRGCKNDPSLFEFYLYDTYKTISSSKSSVNPLAIFDNIFEELQVQLSSEESLSEIYIGIEGCDCFLDWLYKEGFISHTDIDYYNLAEDIMRYKVLKATGDPYPLGSSNLPDASKRRIKRLLDAYISKKYAESLKSEFSDNLSDAIASINNQNESYGGRS